MLHSKCSLKKPLKSQDEWGYTSECVHVHVWEKPIAKIWAHNVLTQDFLIYNWFCWCKIKKFIISLSAGVSEGFYDKIRNVEWDFAVWFSKAALLWLIHAILSVYNIYKLCSQQLKVTGELWNMGSRMQREGKDLSPSRSSSPTLSSPYLVLTLPKTSYKLNPI